MRMTSVLGVLVLVACGGSAPAESTTPAATANAATGESWRTIAPANEGFSVEVPYDAPMQESEVAPGVMQHQYIAAPADGSSAFIVGVVHRAAAASPEEAQQLLRAAYDAMAHADGAQAEEPTPVTLNGETGIGFAATMMSEGQRMVFVTQMFVHGDKFIQFLAILDATVAENGLPESVTRFMRSAQLN
ncbi:MAG: hypothetical protein IPK60_11560 [Sandaracinaceae bacterium]|nr:hypothetical protein [Sandaracinaceae bacterium]